MPTAEFQTFDTPHLIAAALTLVLPVLLTAISRRSARRAVVVGYLWAGALLINEVIHWSYRLSEVGLSRFAQNHLPLHVCGVATLATAATLLFRHRKTYEIAYFWGLVGASNAVITPGGLETGFPGYRFFQYFMAHSGIVVGVLFATWGLRMRPTLGGLFRAFVYLHLFAAAVAVVNAFLGSNYMFLSEPPAGTVSPFFFAPWPWYLPFLDAIGLAMFFAVFSPFLIARARPCRKPGGSEAAGAAALRKAMK